MKRNLTFFLISVAVLFVISSCATIQEGPEGPTLSIGGKEPTPGDELKLLSMELPQSGNLAPDVEYWATINFVANKKTTINKACFNFSGGLQNCVDVQEKDVTYGMQTYFRVPIRVPTGSKRIDCYAEYVRGGGTQRTNTVSYYVVSMKKPEE